MAVPEALLDILRCLECRAPLREVESALECTGCGLHYPVDGAIPVMLADAAYRPDAG